MNRSPISPPDDKLNIDSLENSEIEKITAPHDRLGDGRIICGFSAHTVEVLGRVVNLRCGTVDVFGRIFLGIPHFARGLPPVIGADIPSLVTYTASLPIWLCRFTTAASRKSGPATARIRNGK
jgi:hypothetical protein